MLFRLERTSHFNVNNMANKYNLEILEPPPLQGKNLGLTNFTYASSYGRNQKKAYIKIYNPKISLLRIENEIYSYQLFNFIGMNAPQIIGIGDSIKGPFIMTEGIPKEQFLNQSSYTIPELDDLFFKKFLSKTTNITSEEYGATIDSSIYKVTYPSKYSAFLRCQCQYFLKKYTESRLFNTHTINRLYRLERGLFSKLVEPHKFVLCHGDISPKHMYQNQENLDVGVIDSEMTKSADITVDLSHWLIHTYLLRRTNDIELFVSRARNQKDVIESIFAYNIFREYLSHNYYAAKRNKKSLEVDEIFNLCQLM
jgi:hypothetical protein